MTRTDHLAIANLEVLEAAHDLDHDRARRRRFQWGIEAIDDVLDALEEYHLARRPRNIPLLPAWRARLEEEGGLSIPEDILTVQHTVELHDALVLWQRELLGGAPSERERAR